MEVSLSDSFMLGIEAPVRMSGDLDQSPGIEIIGPRGKVFKKCGVIVAWRHIHIAPELAQQHGLSDGMKIDMETYGDRAGVLRHVVVRVSTNAALEMHIDIEEANGLGLKNGDKMYRYLPPEPRR